MVNRFKDEFSYHRDGFKILKLIHSIDSSAIPVSMLYALFNAIYPYINLFFSAYIIDSLIMKDWNVAAGYVTALVVIDILAGLAKDALQQAEKVKANRVGNYAYVKIREKALSLDYETLEKSKTLEMVNSAEKSMNYRGGIGFLLQYYRAMLEAIFSIVASISLVFYLCFQVGDITNGILGVITSKYVSLIIIVVLLSLVVYINYICEKRFNNKSIALFDEQIKCERLLQYNCFQVIQDYTKAKDIRVYNMQDMLLEENKKARIMINNGYWKIIKSGIKQTATISFVSGFINVAAYLFVVFKVLAKAVTIGSITKYVGALAQLTSGLTNLVKYNDEIRLQCSYLKYYNDFLALENKRDTGTIPIEKRNDNEYEIEFHDVSFAYPETEDLILKNVSLKIKLKEKMAVVGKNGAGKTTFIKLLCRLYDPTSGYITLNGVDIRKYNYEEYLSLFGVVFQDFNLFAFPVDQNVSSSIRPDEERVWRCLEMSGAKGKVEAMENKLKTPLYKYDEGGVEISGGEAQKIAIARGLYKDAPFVILDEPTAALDPISEYEIYSYFNDMVDDKTSVFISHRMSSCRFCNDIVVFDKGQNVQRGSHDALMEDKEGIYYKLFNAQAKYYNNAM